MRARARLSRLASHCRQPPEPAPTAGADGDAAAAAPGPLDASEVAEFLDTGVLVFPGLLDPAHCALLQAAVDEVVRDREQARASRYIVEYEALGGLCAHAPVVERVKQLMRAYGDGDDGCGMHHMHVSRHEAGAVGAKWHHDYNCMPDVHDREQLSIHVFHYFAGLNGTIGDLLVLPRSQHTVHPVRGIGELFQTETLPGTRVIDDLPPGSSVVLHSGLLHARRPRPGGEGAARYFVDAECGPLAHFFPLFFFRSVLTPRFQKVALEDRGPVPQRFKTAAKRVVAADLFLVDRYVQQGRHRWPFYLDETSHKEICAAARASGFERGGRYAHLWRSDDGLYQDSTKFYDFFSSLPSVEG